jgi:hypothetical protein
MLRRKIWRNPRLDAPREDPWWPGRGSRGAMTRSNDSFDAGPGKPAGRTICQSLPRTISSFYSKVLAGFFWGRRCCFLRGRWVGRGGARGSTRRGRTLRACLKIQRGPVFSENPPGGGPFDRALGWLGAYSPRWGCARFAASVTVKTPCRRSPLNFQTGSETVWVMWMALALENGGKCG